MFRSWTLRAFTWFLLLALTPTLPVMARTVTDSADRTVNLPDKVERVFAAGPPAAILLYMLAPEKMTGWPNAPKPSERPFIAAPYRDLPALGRLTGRGGTANLETVLKVKPDLILDFGSVRDTYVSLANNTQAQTGIPYVLIDGRFDATPSSLRLLGKILGVEERAEILARYVEETFTQIDEALDKIPEDKRPRVYLARGPDGLETGLKGSINTEIIERAGGRNVAESHDGRKGLARASMEQLIVANPDTILTWEPHFYKAVYKDPLWVGIAAVKKKRVYLAPTAPFGWIDRPPSLNRVMGLKWLPMLFYPDIFKRDLQDVTREFYKLFYHVTPTDEELDTLIAWSKGTPPIEATTP
ncbi:MAG: iron ABC transporter substrate-binding protein [Hyphomicrobiaceae bacterium]|nr:iron ABC transporter substrate-binding protein [Hyphomicrobiaceae bacterium]MCC0011282.1 iron ABC transporter substrate-binding protein [Hyphomicrobiaceae bacterium]